MFNIKLNSSSLTQAKTILSHYTFNFLGVNTDLNNLKTTTQASVTQNNSKPLTRMNKKNWTAAAKVIKLQLKLLHRPTFFILIYIAFSNWTK